MTDNRWRNYAGAVLFLILDVVGAVELKGSYGVSVCEMVILCKKKIYLFYFN